MKIQEQRRADQDWLRSVSDAQSGDLQAFDTLVRRFQDPVVAYCTAILGDFHLAQDTAQEAFLEAFRTLPTLRIPAAFPGWLRLLAHKYCDRQTRRRQVPTAPMESVGEFVAPGDLLEGIARREMQTTVRSAIEALPASERGVVHLYYGAEYSVKEVAAFLDLPVSTVKNRLLSARRRLHERMLPLMEETLKQQRPSNDDRFRERLFVRLHDDFMNQYRQDPTTADHSLMARSREELERYVAEGKPIDPDTAHFASRLYTLLSAYAPLADLIARYLASPTPLPLAEEAWARWEQVRALAAVGRDEDVVREQRAFVDWARIHLPGDPPIRLSNPGGLDFRPLKEGEEVDTTDYRRVLPVEAIFPWIVNTAEVSLCFRRQGLADEWATIARSLIDAAPKTRPTRLYRFWSLRCIVVMYYTKETLAEALQATEDIRALGAEDPNDWEAPRWAIEATYLQMSACMDAEKPLEGRARGEEATRLLQQWSAGLHDLTPEQHQTVGILFDNVASTLADYRFDDLALSLFPKVIADYGKSPWAYVRYAACLWGATKDRQRVLELLRQGAIHDFEGDLLSFFQSRPAFVDVREDPEFVAAFDRKDKETVSGK